MILFLTPIFQKVVVVVVATTLVQAATARLAVMAAVEVAEAQAEALEAQP
jgi:hypothetical protein